MAVISETWIVRCGATLRAAGARFRSCEAGATSIEYAMIAVLFAVSTIAAWRLVGTTVSRMYNTVGTAVINAN